MPLLKVDVVVSVTNHKTLNLFLKKSQWFHLKQVGHEVEHNTICSHQKFKIIIYKEKRATLGLLRITIMNREFQMQ
jgi:hypothetical protein